MSRQRPTRRRLIGTCYFSFPAALQRSLVPEIDANAGTPGVWLSPTRSKVVNLAHFSRIYRLAPGVIGAWLGAIEELQRECRNRVDLPDYGLAISPQSQTRASQAELLKVRRGVLRGCPWLSRGQGCEGTVVHGGIHSWYRLLQSPVPECD